MNNRNPSSRFKYIFIGILLILVIVSLILGIDYVSQNKLIEFHIEDTQKTTLVDSYKMENISLESPSILSKSNKNDNDTQDIANQTISAKTILNEVHIMNRDDNIGHDTILAFKNEIGIKAIYDVSDSWEAIEAKLLAGNSGYDVAFMDSVYANRQIPAGIYLKLDKDKIPNWSKIDPYILKMLENFDQNNQYLQPWSWYGAVVAYNTDEFVKRFPDGSDSWSILFDPENAKKLSDCGLIWTDVSEDLFVPAMIYYKHDPFTNDRKDYEETFDKLMAIRPYIKLFSNSYYKNLANGEDCASLGWSGNVTAVTPKAGISLSQFIPKEGTYINYIAVGIISDAKNIDEAYAFLNFILKPKEAANFTNDMYSPNPVPLSIPLIKKEVIERGLFYPDLLPKELQSKLYAFPAKQNQSIVRLKTRMWAKFKTAN